MDAAIERRLTLPVDLDEAWRLVTRAEDLRGWLGAEVDLDPTPGGRGRIVDHDGTDRRVLVDDVDEGCRISWTWWTDGTPGEASRVEISLQPTTTGTTVRVVEELVGAAPAARARHGEAWSHRLLHLEALLLVAAAVRA